MPSEDEVVALENIELKEFHTNRENENEEIYMPFGKFFTDA
jgi:hypothetical protein